MRVYKNRWFARFAVKERIKDEMLCEAVNRANSGLVDADLGGGVIKQRVARRGQGRSGGYRTFILFKVGHRAVFAFGFAKNTMENISMDDLEDLRKVAKLTLAYSDSQITSLLDIHELIEVDCHGG